LFVNLFTNAAHAANPLDARVEVEAGVVQDGRMLELKVCDNGQGIQATDIEHVFDPFYTTRGASGCGLGLAIVKDIAEHHGGSISVKSTPLVGTTFVLNLPLGEVAEELGTMR
jgi:signal transduction histidine kinase